jgi:hypothetical protein
MGRSARNQPRGKHRGGSVLKTLEPGHLVAIAADAEWIRQGSDPLPEGWWKTVPKNRQFTPTVPIALLSPAIFSEFMGTHVVSQVFEDKGTAKIRNPQTQRTSIFAIPDLSILEEI